MITGHLCFLHLGAADTRFKDLGCFPDLPLLSKPPLAEARQMDFLARTDLMSNGLCARLAKAQKYRYAATQDGNMCFASNTDPGTLYGSPVSNTSCNVDCKSGSAEKCGGKQYNSMFEILQGEGINAGVFC